MDIEKLKALKVIVETGSITRAAERLGYSQPGLTGMLNRLEQEIDHKERDIESQCSGAAAACH